MGEPVRQGRLARLGIEIDASGHGDPQRLQQDEGVLVGDPPLVEVLSVVRVQVLIDSAVADAAADRLLEARDQLDEPLGLHGLVERPGRVFRNALADLGDLEELVSALRSRFARSHGTGQLGVSTGKRHHGVADQNDRLEEGPLLDLSRRVEGIERVELLLGLFLDRSNTAREHLLEVMGPGQHGPPRSRRGDDEDALHQLPRVVREGVHQRGVILVLLPERQDFVLQNGDVLFRDDDRGARFAGDQLIGVCIEAAGASELGIDHRVAPRQAGASHDEFPLFDVHRVMLQNVGQRLAPAEHRGLAPGVSH
jgi:hypothetical protein